MIQDCSPVFAVTDPKASAEYYSRAFGFEISGEATKEYAVVERDGHQIHFHAPPSSPREPSSKTAYFGGAYFLVDDPDSLYKEFLERGARIHYRPQERPYGMRDFSVLDPEGYSLCFGRRIDSDMKQPESVCEDLEGDSKNER